MRRCCHKHCKTIKVNVKSKPEIAQTESPNDFLKTFDIREKRIGIVFKVIYVIAALFASAFLLVSNGFAKGLSDSYIAYVCFTTFLMQLLYRMIVYIFNELKCLKINGKNITEKEKAVMEKQVTKVEESYTRIFNYFFAGGVASILAGIALLYTQAVITKDILVLISVVGIINGAVIGNAHYKNHMQFWQSLCSMIWTIAFIALFAAMAFEVVS